MPPTQLVGDCASCAALCCVIYPLDASEDFAVSKPAGVPCRHLGRDARCTIHHELHARGFRGCALYDCRGAGQRATRMFAGVPGSDELRARVFLRLREVHELLWYFAQRGLDTRELEALAAGPIDALLEADLRRFSPLKRHSSPWR